MRIIAVSVLLFIVTTAPAGEDLQTESSKEGNFVVSYGPPWEKYQTKSPAIQFAIHRVPDSVIMLRCYESATTLETLLEDVSTEYANLPGKFKEISRAETAVAGERAVMLTFNPSNNIAGMVTQTTIFTHQGIAYRLVGAYAENDINFIADYQEFMERFRFKEPRKEWLEKFEGTPTPTAMLGGLVTFELNRPRWIEKLPVHDRETGYIERSSFHFVAGGGWITVRARMAKGDTAFELDELKQNISGWLRDIRIEKSVTKTPKGDIPGFTVTGVSGKFVRHFRATVLVEDGVALHVWLESLKSQTVVVEPDWLQLLSTLRLQKASNPEIPPAYYWKQRKRDTDHEPLPALTRVLAAATRVFPDERHDILAFAPDASRVVASKGQKCFLEDVSSHQQLPLAEVGGALTAAWSFDGNRVLCASGEKVSMVTLAPYKVESIDESATKVSFGASPEEILAVKAVVEAQRTRGMPANTYDTNRLQVLNLRGERKTLLDFPLSKFSDQCVSPDGKWIAVVCNLDSPRTSWMPGNLCICAPDGTGLRALTHGAESITSIRWAPDSQSVFLLRSPAQISGKNFFSRNQYDICRVDVATGTLRSLTQCGKISTFWIAGKDLLMQINAWDVAGSQRGIFRANIEMLSGNAGPAVNSETATSNPMQSIASRMRTIVDFKKLHKVEFNAEFVRRCAEAFAGAATQIRGEPFDFKDSSLDLLGAMVDDMDLASDDGRIFVLGAGCYYGETLRRCAGAEWYIKAAPFDTWLPGASLESNALARCILPFSEIFHHSQRSEDGYLLGHQDLIRREEGQKLVLVYPPSHSQEAMDEAVGLNYRTAMSKIDTGDVNGALELLTQELQARPSNRTLVNEVIALCKAAGMPDMAKTLTQRAVENGNEVPALLISYGDDIAKTDPSKAMEYYRKATQGDWPPALAFIKLGKIYASLKQPMIADACWRRALNHALREERPEILKLLRFPPETNSPGNDY